MKLTAVTLWLASLTAALIAPDVIVADDTPEVGRHENAISGAQPALRVGVGLISVTSTDLVGLEDGPAAAIALEIQPTRRLALEAGVGVGKASGSMANATTPQSMYVVAFTGTGKLMFPLGRAALFLLGGAGVYVGTLPRGFTAISSTHPGGNYIAPGVHLGAGALWWFSDKTSVGADLRYHIPVIVMPKTTSTIDYGQTSVFVARRF